MKFFKLSKNYFAVSVCAILFFASCDLDLSSSDSSSSSGYSSGTSTSTSATWDASSSNIFEVETGVTTVKITGATSGKNLYFVKRNTGSTSISTESQPYARISSSERSVADEVSEVEELLVNLEDEDTENAGKWHCYIPQEIEISEVSSARSAAGTSSAAVEQIEPVVGETTKEIYVDTDSSISVFEQKDATLYAVGEYCYVWIVDDYYAEEASGKYVTKKQAQELAAAFDSLYNLERYVFGKELEYIYTSNTKRTAIKNVSDTGSMVNIVLYDIANDYYEGQTGGVAGYFFSRDYYDSSLSGTETSNVGKYFYIDSGFINLDFNNQVSTLAHEFQHMIRFKFTKENNISDSTWYNEMLSMLCEDMLQEHLGLEDSDSPKKRTQNFNLYYYICGLNDYNSTSDTTSGLSYSVWSNFGMFIARKYGGAAFVQKLTTMNASADSIAEAVNDINDTSYTFDDLFEQYVQALLGSSEYTHNIDAATTISYTGTDGDESNSYSESNPYSYPMTAYDIFADDYNIASLIQENEKYKYTNYDGAGPFVLSATASAALRPDNGFTLHGIQKMTSTSATVKISSNSNSRLKMYLILL